MIKVDCNLYELRGRRTRVCCFRLRHVQHRQNAFTQSE